MPRAKRRRWRPHSRPGSGVEDAVAGFMTPGDQPMDSRFRGHDGSHENNSQPFRQPVAARTIGGGERPKGAESRRLGAPNEAAGRPAPRPNGTRTMTAHAYSFGHQESCRRDSGASEFCPTACGQARWCPRHHHRVTERTCRNHVIPAEAGIHLGQHRLASPSPSPLIRTERHLSVLNSRNCTVSRTGDEFRGSS